MKRIFILMAMFAITAGAAAQLKVLSNGNIGAGTAAPKEKFQIGDRWTFHNGGTKYIGYNLYYGVNGDTRIDADYSSALRMSSSIGLYVYDTGNAGSTVTTKGSLVLNADGNTTINGQARINSGWVGLTLGWSSDNYCPAIYTDYNNYMWLGRPDRWINHLWTYRITYQTMTQGSDLRLKENITRCPSVLPKIQQIQTYTYNYNDTYFKDFTPEQKQKAQRKEFGFIAQEFERIFPELVYAPDSLREYYEVNYIGMIPVLVEAIKEQQTQIEYLQAMVSEQEKNVILLQEQIHACCQGTPPAYSPPRGPEEGNGKENSEKNTYINNTSEVEKAKLFQNVPNPFSTNTEIRFEIPQNVSLAKLLVHDMQGAEIKSYNVTARGAGSIIIQAQELPAGMYMYTLLVNNTIVDTKKMILTK